MARALAPALTLVLSAPAWAVGDMPGGPAVNQLTLPDPASSIARGQHWMHGILMIICVLICVGVFGTMFYSIYAHRKSKGARPADFHESTAVEIAWTVVPMIIVIGLGIAATGEVIAQKDTSSADITIKATGYQWKWGYDYLKGEGEGITLLSQLSTTQDQIHGRAPRTDTYLMEVDEPMVVPVGRKVRIITTADDVIHAWFVPQLGVKQDAIPGFVRDTWFKADRTGVFRGDCAELCGKDHAFMPIVVDVRSDADYRAWVDTKKKEQLAKADDPNKVWTVDDLKARGEKLYAANCVACHQASGKGVPGAFPALDGSPKVLGPPPVQIRTVLHGVPNTAMAAWDKFSDTEIAALVTYTRNAWSNHAQANLVQPKDVAAERGKN